MDVSKDDLWNEWKQGMEIVTQHLSKLSSDEILSEVAGDENSKCSSAISFDTLNAMQQEVELMLTDVFTKEHILKIFLSGSHDIGSYDSQWFTKLQASATKYSQKPDEGRSKENSSLSNYPPLRKPSTSLRDVQKIHAERILKKAHRRGLPLKSTSEETSAVQNAIPDTVSSEIPAIEEDVKASTSSTLYVIPNKFWALLEPYCADIEKENLHFLEECIRRYEDCNDVLQIPPLPKSATKSRCDAALASTSAGDDCSMEVDVVVKAEADDLAEQNNNNISSVSELVKPPQSSSNSITSRLMTRVQNIVSHIWKQDSVQQDHFNEDMLRCLDDIFGKPLDASFPYYEEAVELLNELNDHFMELDACEEKVGVDDGNGGLTVSDSTAAEVLFEEGSICQDNDTASVSTTSVLSSSLECSKNNAVLSKKLQVSNGFRLATALRLWAEKAAEMQSVKEVKVAATRLETIPEVEGCETQPTAHTHVVSPVAVEDDDVLYIKKKQSQLQEVMQRNAARFKNLHVLAKREWQRQEIYRRLAIADGDILEAYDTLEAARMAKKAPLKRDREAALKALKYRQKVLKDLQVFDEASSQLH